MTREWKFDVRFCKCGRIHMIPTNKIQAALEEDKELVYICGGCGTARVIGADKELDWEDPNKTCYNMYSRDIIVENAAPLVFDINDFESTECGHKNYTEIIYTRGIRVPMMTGEYANSYSFGTFYDMWYPDWYKIERRDITVPEIMQFIEKYKKDQRTVNMERFIRETPEVYLDAISGYLIEGLDWTGTKWDRHK